MSTVDPNTEAVAEGVKPAAPVSGETRKRERSRSIGQRQTRRNLMLEMRLWLVALACGLLVGLAMAGVRVGIVSVEFAAFGVEEDRVATAVIGLAWYHVVLVPFCGGLAVGLILFIARKTLWKNGFRIGGIRDVIYARQQILDKRGRTRSLSSMKMAIKDGILTAILAVLSLGTGASAGREGPAVHIGATLSGAIAYRLDFTPAQVRALLGCGAAAAVASSFNAPLAGLLFAHEVILQRYRISDIGPIAVASVSGSLVTRLAFGNNSSFIPPGITDVPISYFVASPFLGLMAAGIAIVVIRILLAAPKLGDQFAGRLGVETYMLPPLAGLLIGLFALAFPQVLGVGYEATAAAIAGGYGAAFMLILAVAKIAATAVCIGARFGGGVFSSSIFTGAMTGGFFGACVGLLTGDLDSAKVFFTVVGMGAVSGAVIGAPISTTLIVFELTRSYQTAAAVLVAVSLATVIVQAVEGGGIFEKQLREKG